jgi:hypothetical protein
MFDTKNSFNVNVYPGWGPDVSALSLKELAEQWKLYDFFFN